MLRVAHITILLAFFAMPVLADLKPDFVECDAQKAARNAAMDATVGVSGGCDAEKLAKKTKEDAKEAVTPDVDKQKGKLDRDRDHGLPGKGKD